MNRNGFSRGGRDENRPDDFVVPDPVMLLKNAMYYGPWTKDGGGLPAVGELSTIRYAAKDIVFGIAAYIYRKDENRVDVRSYFVGEHQMFEELEPTKAMVITLLCQGWQSGGSLELYFEQGIPLDVRILIERSSGRIISGHEKSLSAEVSSPLIAALSDFSEEQHLQMQEQGVPVPLVCYNTFRGTWSANTIKILLEQKVSLRWLFRQRPDPINRSLTYAYLMQHLCAALLEDYALKRLEDRQFGESMGRHIEKRQGEEKAYYCASKEPLTLEDEQAQVNIKKGESFLIIALLARTSQATGQILSAYIERFKAFRKTHQIVFALPREELLVGRNQDESEFFRTLRANDMWGIVVGLTKTQLRHEAQQKLAITASQLEPDEMDAINVDKHTD